MKKVKILAFPETTPRITVNLDDSDLWIIKEKMVQESLNKITNNLYEAMSLAKKNIKKCKIK